MFRGYITDNGFQVVNLKNGFFLTSDLVTINNELSLVIDGRFDFQFNSGGSLVSPEFIESLLESFEFVDRCIILPQSDKKFGYVPIAIIKTSYAINDLIELCSKHLPIHMRPKDFLPWPINIDLFNKQARSQLMMYFKDSN